MSSILLVAVEALSLLVCLTALVAGTLAEFTLPYRGRGSGLGGCYFTDALIVYVECGASNWLGTAFTWSWWGTWGLHWQIGFLPFSLVTLIPEALTIWLAVRMIRRIIRVASS